MTPSRRVTSFAFTTDLAGAVQAQAPSTAGPGSWVSSWTVGLRPAPGAAACLKKLVITAEAGWRLEGHLRGGSGIHAGRHKRCSGHEMQFAFVTQSGEDAQQTAGRQVSQDRLAGLALSSTRGFLPIRKATRDVAV